MNHLSALALSKVTDADLEEIATHLQACPARHAH